MKDGDESEKPKKMNLRQAFDIVSSGGTAKLRPKGNSMSGKIESGQLVTIEPTSLEDVKKGDIVLCKVHGNIYPFGFGPTKRSSLNWQ